MDQANFNVWLRGLFVDPELLDVSAEEQLQLIESNFNTMLEIERNKSKVPAELVSSVTPVRWNKFVEMAILPLHSLHDEPSAKAAEIIDNIKRDLDKTVETA